MSPEQKIYALLTRFRDTNDIATAPDGGERELRSLVNDKRSLVETLERELGVETLHSLWRAVWATVNPTRDY